MPRRVRKASTIGIDAPQPTITGGLPHSAFNACAVAVGLGAEYQVLGDCHHFNVIESLGEADGPLTDALCEFVASSID